MAEQEEEIMWPGGFPEAKSVNDFDYLMTGKNGGPITKIPKSRLGEVVGVVGESMAAIQGGATAATAVALPAGPVGQNRWFDASWGYWKYNNVVLKNPTGTDGIPEGNDGQLYWNGTTTTPLWSISKIQVLPKGENGADGSNVVSTEIVTDVPVNLYNPANNVIGKQISTANVETTQANETYTVIPLDTTQGAIAIQRLPTGDTIGRYYVFVDASNVVTGSGQIPLGVTSIAFAYPNNSTVLKVNLKGRNAGASLDNIFIEYNNYVRTLPEQLFKIEKVDQKDISALSKADIKVETNNLFALSNVTGGLEYQSTGNTSKRLNESIVKLFLKPSTEYTIWNLPAGATFDRYIYFFRANNTVLSSALIVKSNNSATFTTPSEQAYTGINLLGRNITNAKDVEKIKIVEGSEQVEIREVITELSGKSFKTYDELISALKDVLALLFGDSITETVSVDGLDRSNWPLFASSILGWNWMNYARGGARFKGVYTPGDRKKLSTQIADAIAEQGTKDIKIIVFNILTNDTSDAFSTIGTYEDAMSVTSIEGLNLNILSHAIRYAFWKVMLQWHNAKVFSMTPLRRLNTFNEVNMITSIELLKKIAGYYNVTIIDQYNKAGISMQFENPASAGRYLTDGLHPNVEGQRLQARFIAAEILANYQK